MNKNFIPRNKEFFECDCYDKDHIIRAEYDIDDWTPGDGVKRTFRELTLTFSTKLADYNYTYQTGISGWFKRMKWRIRYSFKLLFTGEVETEGYFNPCRSWINEKENPVEGQFGYQTTKNLAEWLSTKADEIKEAYEQDLKDYHNKINENLSKSTGKIDTL